MPGWTDNIVADEDRIRAILRDTRTIAVLGIKPESRSSAPAHYVARYLQDAGYEVVPVPTYYPEVSEILGRPVFRTVSSVPGAVDMVDVFRRAHDIPPHVDDLIAKAPRVVWFQLGIRNDDAARQLAEAGILVVQDRCTMVDHRRLLGRQGRA